jgi:hypothetical protein
MTEPFNSQASEQRLTLDQVRRVVAATRRAAEAVPSRSLGAKRDLVVIAIGLMFGVPAAKVVGLRWGDVELDGPSPSMCSLLPGDTAGARVHLSPAVVSVVKDFRAALRAEGVDPVAEDAFIPSLDPAVRAAWPDLERDVLSPAGSVVLGTAIHRRFADAGVVPRRSPKAGSAGSPTLAWLGRAKLEDVESVLTVAVQRRVVRAKPSL